MNEKIVEVLKMVLNELDGSDSVFSSEGDHGTINIPVDDFYFATGMLECLITLFEGAE